MMFSPRERLALRLAAAACALLLFRGNARAQCSAPPAGSIVANPNRPTVADPADITQYGVLELEYGWDHVWHGQGSRENNFGGLLKFAALCDLELRWDSVSLLDQKDALAVHRGIGDNRLGAQYRFHHQSAHLPTLAVSYALKIPTASVEKGLGSGRVDHQFKFLASKDVQKIHFDFNTSYFLIGRQAVSGFDQNLELNLSFSCPIKGNLGLTGEIYHDTRLNSATPGFASTLWALTYKVRPRFVIDSGLDVGLTRGSPHRKRWVIGFVYSLTDLYSGRRKRSKTD
jgi:opacity protein-like surface antigen